MTPDYTPRLAAHAALRAGVCSASLWLGLAAHSAAFALDSQSSAPGQAAQSAEEEADNDAGIGSGGIVVEARRLRGQLDVEVEPLLELDPEAIAAEGVASIADLVTQITNQTGSARGRGGGGRPVILVNGIRIGSFREIFQYPPEALEKVEVFPEEVAQRFGFGPDRRVINLILKDNYSSREIELEFEGPDRGGYFVNEQELGYLKITGGGRINANFTAQDRSLLTEAERSVLQTPGSIPTVPGDPDQAEFRSLISDTRSLEASLNWAKAFVDSGTSVSANIEYNRNDSRALAGLNTVTLTDAAGNSELRTFGEATPLERITASDSFSAAGSLSKRINSMQLVTSIDASRTDSETLISRLFDTSTFEADALSGALALDAALPASADAGFDVASSQSTFAFSNTTLQGPIAYLPGGDLTATFDASVTWQNLFSEDTRTLSSSDLTRRRLSTGANLVVPITSRRNGFADALGSFTLNLSAGVDDLSDFGVLGDYTVGLTWSPFDSLDLSATYIYREVAPDLASLGSPVVTSFNVPIFDFTNGETALVTLTSGGNPGLLAETQTDWKFAANWNLPFIDNTRLSIEYIRNRSRDVTAGFPSLTPAIEAAFSDRVTRDAGGALTALDFRPVTFAETRADRLQFNLSTRGQFGRSQQAGGRGGRPGGGPPAGAGGGGRPAQADAPAQAQSEAQRPSAGGPPASDRRAQFMQFRTRLCADDGLDFLTRLVAAAESGEPLSGEFEGYDAAQLERMLSRLRGADGEVSAERLAGFREQICSMDPAMFGGRGGPRGGDGPDGAQGGPRQQAFAILREKICGDDGAEQLAKIVAAIEAGEDVSDILPGMNPEMLKRMLDRMRGEDGKISPEALEQLRSRICESGGDQNSGQGSQGGPPAISPAAFFGGRGRGGGWRYFLSFNHTIELQNEILIAPGVPVLDQLDGDATSAFGLPRHNSRLEGGLFGNGIGFRLSGRYTGSTRIDGSALVGSSDLFFDDLVTFDLRIFSNLGEITGKNEGILKNMRVSLRMDNMFDTRRNITDQNGDTPINFQPFLIDPTGRFVGIDIRKLF